MEVGFSQDAGSLETLAKDYYRDSNGDVKIVLTVKVRYASVKKRLAHTSSDISTLNAPLRVRGTSFCLYRGPERVCSEEVFRDVYGRSVGDGIRLFLSDFIPDSTLEQVHPAL